jgi:hypothetical protein
MRSYARLKKRSRPSLTPPGLYSTPLCTLSKQDIFIPTAWTNLSTPISIERPCKSRSITLAGYFPTRINSSGSGKKCAENQGFCGGMACAETSLKSGPMRERLNFRSSEPVDTATARLLDSAPGSTRHSRVNRGVVAPRATDTTGGRECPLCAGRTRRQRIRFGAPTGRWPHLVPAEPAETRADSRVARLRQPAKYLTNTAIEHPSTDLKQPPTR